jgi:hypothetical protein
MPSPDFMRREMIQSEVRAANSTGCELSKRKPAFPNLRSIDESIRSGARAFRDCSHL